MGISDNAKDSAGVRKRETPFQLRIRPADLQLITLAAATIGRTRAAFARRALIGAAKEILRRDPPAEGES